MTTTDSSNPLGEPDSASEPTATTGSQLTEAQTAPEATGASTGAATPASVAGDPSTSDGTNASGVDLATANSPKAGGEPSEDNPLAGADESERYKTTQGISSLEAPPTTEGVPVPRVGSPDPIPDAPGAVGDLEPVSRETLEAAAEADLAARRAAEERMFSGRRQPLPPVTHADQNVLGNAAPNNQPISQAPEARESAAESGHDVENVPADHTGEQA